MIRQVATDTRVQSVTSPIAPRGGCAYSRLGAIEAVSAVQRSQAAGAVRLAGDAPSIGAEVPPVDAPRPDLPGWDRHRRGT